jgi:hypothetical protein
MFIARCTSIWNVLHYINMAEFGNLNHSILHIFCDLKVFSRLHRCCWRSAIWTILQDWPVQSVPITTNVVSSNHVHSEVYMIQHYVIKFVSNLRQVGGFHRILRILHIFCDLKVFSRLHRCCWRSAIWTILHCINVSEFGNLKHSMLLIFGILLYKFGSINIQYCEIWVRGAAVVVIGW